MTQHSIGEQHFGSEIENVILNLEESEIEFGPDRACELQFGMDFWLFLN